MTDDRRPALSLHVGGTGSGFEEARRRLSAFLERSGVDRRWLGACELAFEEIVVNVLRHGGDAPMPDGTRVAVRVEVDADEVRLRFEDAGPPFDPTLHPEPPAPASIETAPVGGLGILLVRRTARRFEYRRLGAVNRVDLAIATA